MLENIKIIALALKIIIWSLFPPTLLYAVTRNMTLSVSLWFLIAVAEVLLNRSTSRIFRISPLKYQEKRSKDMLRIIVFIVKLFVWSLLPALALYLATGSVVLSVMLWIVIGSVEVLSRLEVHRDLNKDNVKLVEDFGRLADRK